MAKKLIIPNKKASYKYNLLKLDLKRRKTYIGAEKKISKLYKKKNGKEINWLHPKTYTEKVSFSKLYCFSKLKSDLTDKYKVRNWIKNKIGETYLIPLLGVYNSFDEIDFSLLPNEFVIKCNHDSGSITIINNKENINIKELKAKYDYYIKRNFASYGYEMHYNEIIPKIIIEKHMGDNINDYKFLCFNGKPYYCWVDLDRFINHKRNFYDLKWNLQPFNQAKYGNTNQPLKCPKRFNEMVEVAEKLSKGFDQVRIDLYDIDERIYFGEMTFTNGNGMQEITPEEWDIKLGSLWNLDTSNRDKLRNCRINWNKYGKK